MYSFIYEEFIVKRAKTDTERQKSQEYQLHNTCGDPGPLHLQTSV